MTKSKFPQISLRLLATAYACVTSITDNKLMTELLHNINKTNNLKNDFYLCIVFNFILYKLKSADIFSHL